MIAPGPDAGQLHTILEAAMRVPDHGKLAPWRFVIVEQDQRDLLAKLLVDAYRAEKPGAGRLELEAMEQFARQAPTRGWPPHRLPSPPSSPPGNRKCRSARRED